MKNLYATLRLFTMLCGCLALATAAQSQPSTGYRMIAAATYLYSGGVMAASDSTQFFFPTLATDTYDVFESYTAFGGGGWRPRAKYIYTFDAQGRVKQLDGQNWSTATSTYVPSTRQMDSLNSSGQLIQQTTQQWNAAGSTYVNWRQMLFTRNAAHQILDQVTQNWNSASSGWVNDMHITHGFNQQGMRTSQVYQRWKTATGAWRNADSFATVFNATGMVMTQSLAFSWDTTANAWKASSRQSHSYDAAGNRILVLSEIVNTSGTWVPVSKDSTTYTSTNNPDVNIASVWNAATSSYDNQGRTTITYDPADLPVLTTMERWVSGAWSLATNGAYLYYRYFQPFGTPSGLAGTQATKPELRLSPVPANESLHFSLSAKAPQSFTASIIDMQGRVLQSFSAQARQFDIDISTAAMPAGTYFVRVLTADGQAVSRMISIQH